MPNNTPFDIQLNRLANEKLEPFIQEQIDNHVSTLKSSLDFLDLFDRGTIENFEQRIGDEHITSNFTFQIKCKPFSKLYTIDFIFGTYFRQVHQEVYFKFLSIDMKFKNNDVDFDFIERKLEENFDRIENLIINHDKFDSYINNISLFILQKRFKNFINSEFLEY